MGFNVILPSLSLSIVESDRKVAVKESSDLVETAEEEEDDRVNEGRGLLLGCCAACCAADAKYDAGLNERLAIFGQQSPLIVNR